MTAEQLDALMTATTFPGYTWRLQAIESGWLVWASFKAACTVSGGDPVPWTTRKWYVSQHACRSEVVGTLFKLVVTSLEHEAREMFKVDGRAVFDPHVDVAALASICGNHETRQAG